jgi:hypothetical protein
MSKVKETKRAASKWESADWAMGFEVLEIEMMWGGDKRHQAYDLLARGIYGDDWGNDESGRETKIFRNLRCYVADLT